MCQAVLGRTGGEPARETAEAGSGRRDWDVVREQREEGTSGGSSPGRTQSPEAEAGHGSSRSAVFQVEPFASLSEAVRSSVPRVFMNQEAAGSLAWRPRSRDVLQLGELVDGVDKLVELLGWTEELKDLVQRETGQVQAQRVTLTLAVTRTSPTWAAARSECGSCNLG